MNYLKPKLFSCIKGYNAQQMTKDIIAGIIVAVIALPLSIASRLFPIPSFFPPSPMSYPSFNILAMAACSSASS